MKSPSPPAPIAITAHLRLWTAVALAVVTALALLVWLSGGTPAEGSHSPAAAPQLVELTAPLPLVNAAQDNPETAFPEDAAGFSAYYRLEGQQDTQPQLDVVATTAKLLETPDPSNKDRTKPGIQEKLGANFAIVNLPMVAAIGPGPLVRNVTVYYDDRGWIVAYLPANEPAAAIWRYDGGAPKLEPNLLVLAINEVLSAATLTSVSHDDVGYYDWQNSNCNAFVLFSHQNDGNPPEPVNFVIPPRISEIHASAAVLITSRYDTDGAPVSASVVVEEERVATANETNLLSVAGFSIARPTDENGNHQTSLHQMTVTVSENDTATGVVMLLYKKPAS